MDTILGYTNCNIEQVSVHMVGNKTNEEELHLSKTELDISEIHLRELLTKFFLNPFEGIEFYNFTFPNGDIDMNPMYNFASKIFEDRDLFHKNSIDIAKHLFESSTHPNIKSGDLFIATFSGIHIGADTANVIGIFKSENKHSFLKLNQTSDDFSINFDDGINIEKLDKGCLIFDIDQENGYKVCSIDKSNRSVDAHYWKDTFLQITPCNDNFNSTKEFLNITKKFITKQIPEEYEVTKADKVDLLNRSMDYFKSNDAFDQNEFETEVFQDENMIESFHNFDNNYKIDNGLDIGDNFGISAEAVKKQSRLFKSIIKLDKNFHIYVHGNKNLIQQGIDNDGRKYYKIYFENEQ